MAEPKNLLIARVEELLEIERRYRSVFLQHPVPFWIKFLTQEDRLVMGIVNTAYTEATGISVNAYHGRPDNVVWITGESEEFSVVDRLVLRTGTQHQIAEKGINPRTKKVQYWVGWKWPYVYQQKVIAVVGQAQPYPEEFWLTHGELILTAQKGN